MKIKMCGITTPADVAAVNEVRPDYIGMVMYFPKSKRKCQRGDCAQVA